MELLSGKAVAEAMKEKIRGEVSSFGRPPLLVVLLNREDASSAGYVRSIVRTAEAVGIAVRIREMDQEETAYLAEIQACNDDPKTDAVLITRPLGKGLNEERILSAVLPYKDADAINPRSLGNLLFLNERFVPNTAQAIVSLLEYYRIPIQGKRVLVVGRSLSVGKPAALLLLNRNATVTVAHSRSQTLDEELLRSDIVVAAVGKPQLLKGAKMKPGAIVIDAGIHYTETGIVGDVEPSPLLGALSMVPGGVGPVTITCLMETVVACYRENAHGK